MSRKKDAQEKVAIIAMDPFSAALNVGSNWLRTTESPIAQAIYDPMARSSVRSGLAGTPTRPFFRGVFGASPLSQPFDPVLTAEDVGSTLRKVLRETTEEFRGDVLAKFREQLTPENLKKVPSEYRPGVRALGKLDDATILERALRDGRKGAKPLAEKGSYIAGTALGALFPQPTPGKFVGSAMVAANAPWIASDAGNAIVDKKLQAVRAGKKPGPIKKWIGGKSRELMGGIIDGATSTKPLTAVQKGNRAWAGLASMLVSPAVRSGVEQAQTGFEAMREGRRVLEEATPEMRRMIKDGLTTAAEQTIRKGGAIPMGYLGSQVAQQHLAPHIGETAAKVIGGAAGGVPGAMATEALTGIAEDATGKTLSQVFGRGAEQAGAQAGAQAAGAALASAPAAAVGAASHGIMAPRSSVLASGISDMVDDVAMQAGKRRGGVLWRLGKFLGTGMRRS